MFLSDFDYELPPELIASHPPEQRTSARLLSVADKFEDHSFSALPSLLRAGDLLVFNNTRVIRARLHGQKASGGKVEILVERIRGQNECTAQVRASKTPRKGSEISFADGIAATVTGRQGEFFELRFDRPIAPVLERYGETPLPPYIGRAAESADDERYQTVYAHSPGAVAAPTAGLHFDKAMLQTTAAMGVNHAYLTLHVGAGTFRPLRNETAANNRLHAERLDVSEEVCDAVRETRRHGGRVLAVGTTSVRALESASANGELRPMQGETDIFIRPGHRFHSVDLLLTNFHLPKSSLMMLVAAFAGRERILAAYRHAVREQYRFFSYGDAMLIYPDKP